MLTKALILAALTGQTVATVNGISMKVWPFSSLMMIRRTLPS